MRGLKLLNAYSGRIGCNVASFTDAWIETSSQKTEIEPSLSHLLQMRGLKRLSQSLSISSARRIFYRCVDWNANTLNSTKKSSTSHLLQMRGLKPIGKMMPILILRRIFYRCVDWNQNWEAWRTAKYKSHLLQMRGLKLLISVLERMKFWSHLLQMRGLKQVAVTSMNRCRGRIFYRCVDWNPKSHL